MTLQQAVPPTETDLLNAVKKSVFTTFNSIQIGIIQSFDTSTQTAQVQFALKEVISVEPDGTRILKERPLIFEVPVMILYGGGSYISFPITAGDNCILLFNDREIDQWFANGGVQTPVTARMHDASDAIAIVGLRSLQNSISNYLANGVRLYYNDTCKIDLTTDAIDSIAALFTHTGDMTITGDLIVEGDSLTEGNSTTEGNHIVQGGMSVWGQVTGNGSAAIEIDADMTFTSGNTLSGAIVDSANGATGTYGNSVTVVNGIVTGGT